MKRKIHLQSIISRHRITYAPVLMSPYILQRKALKIFEKYRSEWGCNQSQMGDLLGVSASTYRNWLICKRLMPVSAIESLATIAGIPLVTLMNEISNEL